MRHDWCNLFCDGHGTVYRSWSLHRGAGKLYIISLSPCLYIFHLSHSQDQSRDHRQGRRGMKDSNVKK